MLLLACTTLVQPLPRDSMEPRPFDTALGDHDPSQPEGDHCEESDRTPVGDWLEGRPEDHGLDPRLLEEAAAYAGANKSNCMVVIRHGVLVAEWTWNGVEPTTPVKSWSVGKSYASTTAGLALDRGDLGSVQDSIAEYIPELRGDPRETVTLHHLMSMTSGLHFELIADNLGIATAKDMTQLALDNPLDNEPGQLWEYNNHTVQMMEPVLRNATGMAPDEYIDQHLWTPMGMNAEWMRDEEGHPAMFMNVLASCRDHAKFGQLFLEEGCWDGERLLSREWVRTATTSSTDLNRGYGYWWWLNGERPTLDSVDFHDKGQELHPFAPDDAFCAVGLGSQMIEVIPSLDMVVVRMGVAPHDDPEMWLTPLVMLEQLMIDGEQIEHNGVLERVLAAVTD